MFTSVHFLLHSALSPYPHWRSCHDFVWYATRQEFSFGKTYAAYGGIFIAMAVFWGWFVDKRTPDH
nr:hypothetical protein [Alicyclobacillus sp. SO9]